MTGQDFLAFCASLEGALVDRPFAGDFETTVARHTRGRKWFAILMNRDGREFVNLKCPLGQAGLLLGMFQGIRPAWHMNKEHWVSVYLDSDVPDTVVFRLVQDSHRLTAPKVRKIKAPPEEGFEP